MRASNIELDRSNVESWYDGHAHSFFYPICSFAPHTVEGQHLLRCRPNMLAVNCNLTRMSIIDINGVLSFYDLEAKGSGKGGTQGEHLSFERKVSFAVKTT